MTMTATVPLERDQPEPSYDVDPFPETDAFEQAVYAVRCTSDALKTAAEHMLFKQSIHWANELSRARVCSLQRGVADPSRTRLTARLWNEIHLDSHVDEETALPAPRTADLAIALAPFLEVGDEWFSNTIESVLHLTELDFNWNGFGGEPLRNEEAMRSVSLLAEIRDAISEEPFIYPTPLGGTVLEFNSAPRKITVVMEDDIGLISKQGDVPRSFNLNKAWDQFLSALSSEFSSS